MEIFWRDTWPDDERIQAKQDYVASFDGVDIGRVYENFSGADGVFWQWYAWFHVVPNSGSCPSRREAMVTLEEHFERWWADLANRTREPFD